MKNLQVKLSQLRKPNNEVSNVSQESEYTYPTEVLSYRLISVIIGVLFLFTFVINKIVDRQLNTLKNSMDGTVQRIESYQYVEDEYVSISKSLDKYQSYKTTKIPLSKKVEVGLKSVPSDLSVENFTVSDADFTINLKGKSVLSFVTLIDSYFKNPLITSVILDSASIVSNNESEETQFSVNLKGVFKWFG